MLVLSRKKDERIALVDQQTGEQIAEIVVVSLSKTSERARIGIEAEGRYRIVRKELLSQPEEPGQPEPRAA